MNKVKGSFFRASMVSIWMNSLGVGVFTTRTVDEMLWGYEDPLLVRIAPTNPDVEKVFGLMYKVRHLTCLLFIHREGGSGRPGRKYVEKIEFPQK